MNLELLSNPGLGINGGTVRPRVLHILQPPLKGFGKRYRLIAIWVSCCNQQFALTFLSGSRTALAGSLLSVSHLRLTLAIYIAPGNFFSPLGVLQTWGLIVPLEYQQAGQYLQPLASFDIKIYEILYVPTFWIPSKVQYLVFGEIRQNL